MIKQKGFHDYLKDDPTLAEKYTYAEFNQQQTQSTPNLRKGQPELEP